MRPLLRHKPLIESYRDIAIPVARIADMLLNPGGAYDFNGERRTYPDIQLIYWAGGNPFHHHQDLNRLRKAWRKPQTVIVHESWWNPLARHADIVLPVTTSLERNDIAASNRDRFIAASHRVTDPAGEARDDFAIFSGIATRLGVSEAFTDGRDEEAWLRHLYTLARQRTAAAGYDLPDFETFWKTGFCLLPESQHQPSLLETFREEPESGRLNTPSGRIEIFSSTIESFGYDDCPGHPTWLEPHEWLGRQKASEFPLHLLSNQPVSRLHSQYDCGSHSRSFKIRDREVIRLHPEDAKARGISDHAIVRVFNERGSCLAAVVLSNAVRPGVVQLSTGAWYDPADPSVDGSLEKHGNPNVLTRDHGTSRLAQGPSAQSCLVEVELFNGDVPPVTAFEPPLFSTRQGN